MADTLDSKSSTERCEGSSPFSPTITYLSNKALYFIYSIRPCSTGKHLDNKSLSVKYCVYNKRCSGTLIDIIKVNKKLLI